MKSDPPLMDEDDDSLIQQQQQHFPDPNQTPSNSKSSFNYSNCSHFKLPPSHTTKSLKEKDSVHLEKPSSSSSKTTNKENVNCNNVEVPKLGMGPMQMKRKKKGGGYNLRKSLAWDRAFFTDEGILDPHELTLITGINANTCGGGLQSISEEGDSSLSSDTRCTKGPKDKETYEEDRLKELQDKSRTPKVKGEKKTGCSVGNHDSSPHRKVTQKFLSVDRTNRAGSKVGVPEPLAASSLKRPANSSTLKTTKKESKLPKLPISKPGSLYSATTKGSTTASQLRHNSIPKPTIKVEKDVALKSSVKNVHGSQSKAKIGSSSLRLPTKEPAKRTVRNLTNSSSKGTSSIKSRLVQVDKANSGSEVVPDRFQLSEIQERSAPPSAKNQAQHITPNLNNPLPEAARPTSSAPYHIERASNGSSISDRLRPSANQEQSATLASTHHMSLQNIGIYSPNTNPARPSGLRLPSPSLRFFDQTKVQLHNTNLGSNGKIGELRPPAAPARTPMKSNDIIENVCSMVPLPNYLRSTTKGVTDSDIYPNLERKIMQEDVIKMQYDCSGSEVQIQKAIEKKQKRTIGHDGSMKIEKFARNNNEEIKETHFSEQLGEGIGANIHLVGNEGNNKVGVETQEMSEGNDERVPFVPETKGGFVLHNEVDRLQNHTAISMSTSRQSIQHQEQNISTAVVGYASFMQDLAQTSIEQVDTEKSDAPKVNPESHLDVASLKIEGPVCKVFAEPHKDGIGKSENDAGPTKGVGSGSQNCSVVIEHINIGQENDVAKVVDDLYKSSHMEDDAGCSADSPCKETKGRVSIKSRESLKDEAGNGGNTDAREMEGTVTMLDTSAIPFQNMDTEQGNNDADNVSVFTTRHLSIRDAGKLVLHDHSSTEGFYINPSTSIENKVQLQDSPERDVVMLVQHDNPSAESFHINTSTSFKNKAQLQDSPVRDGTTNQSAKCFETTIPCVSALLNYEFNSEGWSVNHIMPAESSSLEEDPCDNVTEISDCFFQEKGRSNYSKAILMEVLDQKQDGVDVALIPGKPFEEARLGFRKVAPLIDDNNHSSLSCLRPEVELISATPVDDDAFCKTESVLQVAECASTYPQSLEKEGLNLAAAVTSEAEFKIDEENQKSQEMGIIIRSSSRKSIVAEQSQHSCGNMEVNASIQGCTDGAETYNEFQSENKTVEGSKSFNNFPKTNLENAQMQLLDDDILVRSCSSLTPVLHNHSIQNVDHSDMFEEQPEFSDDGMKLEKDLISNHQLLLTTDSLPQECVYKEVLNVVDQSDVYECDKKPSNSTIHSPPAEQAIGLHHNNNGQRCYGTSGSTEIDSMAEHNENYSDRQFTYNTECSDLPPISELKSSGNDEMEGVNTYMEYCSSGEESSSFLKKVADSMLEEMPTFFGEFGQVSADHKQVCMESLSPEKNPNLDKPNNALSIIIGHGCDYDLQNSNASALLPTVQGNVSDLNGEDQPNEPQAFDVIMPSQEKCDYVTNERSGYGLESSGQDPLESNSNFPMSQYTTTDGKFTSTASVPVESCSAAGGDKSFLTSTCRIGAEESTISFEEEVETGKHPIVGEFKHNKDATKRSNSIKKLGNSLVIHPPNAVPFSDEWLAAIEAAGEEILTLKHGAVQHSPPDKCLPEPSPWSPVKKKGNQIGPYDCTKYTNVMPSDR